MIALVSVAGLASACGGSRLEMRIYDPSGNAKPEVATPDFIRRSARAIRFSGQSMLSLRLTDTGAKKFKNLTRILARRGARLHRMQAIAFEVDGHTYARAAIDYRLSPNGFDGSSGIEFSAVPPKVARRLAKKIRGS